MDDLLARAPRPLDSCCAATCLRGHCLGTSGVACAGLAARSRTGLATATAAAAVQTLRAAACRPPAGDDGFALGGGAKADKKAAKPLGMAMDDEEEDMFAVRRRRNC